MKINWKARFSNLNFWIAFIPALLLLVQTVASVFGFELNLSALQQQLLDVVNAIFGVLVILGVVNDPTTAGLRDSNRALGYGKPFKDFEV